MQSDKIKKKKIILLKLLALLVVFVFVFTAIITANEELPDKPKAGGSKKIVVEKTELAGKGENGQGKGNAEQSRKEKDRRKNENPKPERPDPPRQEEKRPDQNNEVKEKLKGVIDSLKPNADASNKEGKGIAGEETPIPQEDDNKEPKIATDLKTNITITEHELRDDIFKFYAYIVHKKKNMHLEVKLTNDETGENGKYQKSKNGKDYAVRFAYGMNKVSIYVYKGDDLYVYQHYHIRYERDKANKNKPTVGKHPPTITTNLDNFSGYLKTQKLIFLVNAKNYKGKYIPYSNIQVTYNGQVINTTPTGSPNNYEYEIEVDPPAIGDYADHTLEIVAWDNEHNSRYKVINFKSQFHSEEAVIGHATVNVDMTTVGVPYPTESVSVEIKNRQPASYQVEEALKELGFDTTDPITHSGTFDDSFYIQALNCSYIKYDVNIPQDLLEKIKEDQISVYWDQINRTAPEKNIHSLGEFDYTEGSGWMYSINGTLYPGRALSAWYLRDGDILTLRFTLAWGKDLGLTYTGAGQLPTYGKIWQRG